MKSDICGESEILLNDKFKNPETPDLTLRVLYMAPNRTTLLCEEQYADGSLIYGTYEVKYLTEAHWEKCDNLG
ncbi:hypothetical protein [Paenibacillus aestuarii]|uniref:Uncharacterized protein n=1 Tax=Paenibacillus aestuarii TaxID=516965 RepID=A0ABW0KHB1_9BACL|nr:hypothetical protein [Paenibacillus aestuarii]